MIKTYTTFYNEYRAKLISYLLRMSRDYELSKDIMQESFTRHFQHYKHDKALTPSLLFTIARNALIDYQRNQTRSYRSKEISQPFPLPVVMDEEKAFGIHEEMRQVMDAFEKLSSDDREALSMAVRGLAYKQIADVLGLSESNTKIKIHRARKILRKKLSKGEK